jgi:hypothetical protein
MLPWLCVAPSALLIIQLSYPDLTVGPIYCRSFGPEMGVKHLIPSYETDSPDPSDVRDSEVEQLWRAVRTKTRGS